MSIRIDRTSCVGCGRCVEVCPGNLIKLAQYEVANASQAAERPRARIRHPEDCWGCTSCLKACPVQAIQFFLGADIGGAGSTMQVSLANDIYTWTVTSPDGSTRQIQVNRKDSNKY